MTRARSASRRLPLLFLAACLLHSLSNAAAADSALVSNTSLALTDNVSPSSTSGEHAVIISDVSIVAAPSTASSSSSSGLQKRHTYSRNGNNVDVKKNRRCYRKRRGCKKGRTNRYKKMCHRKEKKCRNRMSDKCRRQPGCSRKCNKRCHRKFERCISGSINHRPVSRDKGKEKPHPNDPYNKLVPQPDQPPERKLSKEKQPCRVTSDCIDGLCCAQHGVGLRICKSFTKIGQICTRTFDRRRSVDQYERCPCEVGLVCQPDTGLEHHYSCQGMT